MSGAAASDGTALAAGLSGAIEGDEHVLPVRVYYEDTDAGGIVYHANYLRYAERARTEMLRLVGIDQSDARRDHGVAFAVKDCQIDYRAPAQLDDLLEVRSRVTGLGGATIRADQRITRAGEVLVSIAVRVACIGRDGRPARFPPLLRHALQSYYQRPLRG